MRFPILGAGYFGGFRPNYDVTYFARCTVHIRSQLPRGVFPVRDENRSIVEYPTEPGIYNVYLWKDQIEDAEIAGCEVEVIEGRGWPVLTTPTKTPPHLYSKQERIFIYAIVDELIREVYIGQTGNLKRRRAEHLRATEKSPKVAMIQNLRARGCKPELLKLEEVPERNARERERFWISYYKSQGYKITNRTNTLFSVRCVE